MDDEIITSTIAGSAVLVSLQKYFKDKQWYQQLTKAVPGADKYFHRTVAGIGSLIVAVGINISFEGSADTGWKFSGNIPPLLTLLHGLWEWTKIFALQTYMYNASRDKAGVKYETTNIDTAVVVPGKS